MRRREVIAALGAAAWSGGVWAQPAERVHRLGALLPAAQVARSFREATVPELAKLGFVEGRNLVIDARLASSDKMPVVAAELVRSNPDAILAVGGRIRSPCINHSTEEGSRKETVLVRAN